MPKRRLTVGEAGELRTALHVAALDALMASRRWQPGELVFQGGSSLHLAHGSPRFSEDLDFLVNARLKLDALSGAMQARLTDTRWLPADTDLTVGIAKPNHNPYVFVVVIGGPNVIGAVRVKVELWRAPTPTVAGIKVVVAPVRVVRGPAAGMQTFVPTADLTEILADKVFALAARPYLKPRDVFDLYWLKTHAKLSACSVPAFKARLATYPKETPSGWLAKARRRIEELPTAKHTIMTDLQRWLPSTWALSEPVANDMIALALEALHRGVGVMAEIEAEP